MCLAPNDTVCTSFCYGIQPDPFWWFPIMFEFIIALIPLIIVITVVAFVLSLIQTGLTGIKYFKFDKPRWPCETLQASTQVTTVSNRTGTRNLIIHNRAGTDTMPGSIRIFFMIPQCSTCIYQWQYLEQFAAMVNDQEEFNRLYMIVQIQAAKHCTYYFPRFH